MATKPFTGYLHKRGHVNKAWKLRFFELDGATLTYYKKQQGKLKGAVKLGNAAVVDSHDLCFDILHPGTQGKEKSLNLRARNLEDKKQWLTELQQRQMKYTILREGSLNKYRRWNKGYKTVYVLLTIWGMAVYKKQGGKLICSHAADELSVHEVSSADIGGLTDCFHVQANRIAYLFHAENSEDMEAWMEAFKDVKKAAKDPEAFAKEKAEKAEKAKKAENAETAEAPGNTYKANSDGSGGGGGAGNATSATANPLQSSIAAGSNAAPTTTVEPTPTPTPSPTPTPTPASESTPAPAPASAPAPAPAPAPAEEAAPPPSPTPSATTATASSAAGAAALTSAAPPAHAASASTRPESPPTTAVPAAAPPPTTPPTPASPPAPAAEAAPPTPTSPQESQLMSMMMQMQAQMKALEDNKRQQELEMQEKMKKLEEEEEARRKAWEEKEKQLQAELLEKQNREKEEQEREKAEEERKERERLEAEQRKHETEAQQRKREEEQQRVKEEEEERQRREEEEKDNAARQRKKEKEEELQQRIAERKRKEEEDEKTHQTPPQHGNPFAPPAAADAPSTPSSPSLFSADSNGEAASALSSSAAKTLEKLKNAARKEDSESKEGPHQEGAGVWHADPEHPQRVGIRNKCYEFMKAQKPTQYIPTTMYRKAARALEMLLYENARTQSKYSDAGTLPTRLQEAYERHLTVLADQSNRFPHIKPGRSPSPLRPRGNSDESYGSTTSAFSSMPSQKFTGEQRYGAAPHPSDAPIIHFPAPLGGGLRLQLVLDKRPEKKPDLPKLNKWQFRQCANCGAEQTTGRMRPVKKAIYCYYTELLMCSDCAGDVSRPIPWRIIHNLDEKPYRVCTAAAEFLDIQLDIPVINLRSQGTAHLTKVKGFEDAETARWNMIAVLDRAKAMAERGDNDAVDRVRAVLSSKLSADFAYLIDTPTSIKLKHVVSFCKGELTSQLNKLTKDMQKALYTP